MKDDYFECWPAGGKEVYFFTEDKTISATMRKEFGSPTVYSRSGKDFAWQFLLSKKIVCVLKLKFEKQRALSQEQNREKETQ